MEKTVKKENGKHLLRLRKAPIKIKENTKLSTLSKNNIRDEDTENIMTVFYMVLCRSGLSKFNDEDFSIKQLLKDWEINDLRFNQIIKEEDLRNIIFLMHEYGLLTKLTYKNGIVNYSLTFGNKAYRQKE